jgi:four helix bundle protein
MSNIAEGYSRQTDKEFTQFLFIARGSTAEVQSQLYVALDLEYINSDKFKLLYQDTIIIIKLLSGFIKYLQKTNKKRIID